MLLQQERFDGRERKREREILFEEITNSTMQFRCTGAHLWLLLPARRYCSSPKLFCVLLEGVETNSRTASWNDFALEVHLALPRRRAGVEHLPEQHAKRVNVEREADCDGLVAALARAAHFGRTVFGVSDAARRDAGKTRFAEIDELRHELTRELDGKRNRIHFSPFFIHLLIVCANGNGNVFWYVLSLHNDY